MPTEPAGAIVAPTSKSRRNPPLWLKLSVSLTTVVLMLVMCEVGLRIVGARPRTVTVLTSYFQPDSQTGWQGRPDASMWFSTSDFHVRITHDQDGLRTCGLQTRIEDDRNHRGRVVWCVGDSITWGWGVEDADTWVAKLNEASNDGTIYRNLGVSGFSSLQEYYMLKSRFERGQRPTEVLLVFCPNDLQDNLNGSRSAPYYEYLDGTLHLRNYPAKLRAGWNRRAWLKKSLLTYNYASYGLICLKGKLKNWRSAGSSDSSSNHASREKDKAPVEGVDAELLALQQAYTQIQSICQEHGVRLTIATYEPAPRVDRVCRELSLAQLDLAPYLQGDGDTAQQVTFEHDRHWNELGNRLAAQGVRERLAVQRVAQAPGESLRR